MVRHSALAESLPEPWMTLATWAALPEDEPGELVDGQLVEEEMPDSIHEVVVSWAIGMFRGWIIGRGGLVLGSEAKFAVSAPRGRKPDASVYLPESNKPPRRGAIRVPPDIMVEVVSPTPRDARRDRVEKLHEYAQFGVRWYWIIDPQERTLEILELGADGRYVHALSVADGTVDQVPGAPELTLDIDALWSEVERLGPESGEEPIGTAETE